MTLLLTLAFAACALSAHPYQCDAAASHGKGTSVSGGQYFNETWDAEGSPYRLAKDVKIGKGAVITVGPGAVVLGGGHRLDVDGTFRVQGGEDEPAQLLNVNISFGTSALGQIDIAFARIEGGSLLDQKFMLGQKGKGRLLLRDSFVTGAPPIYLYMPTGECSLERNVFSRTGGISVGTDGVEVIVKNNVFHKQTTNYAVSNWARYGLAIPAEETADGKPQWFPMDMIVRFNTFLCADQIALRLEPQYNDAKLDLAKDNYFSVTEPDAVAAMIYDKKKNPYCNTIKYEPFLDEPHPDTPYVPDLTCEELTPGEKRQRKERRSQFQAFAGCDEPTAEKFLRNAQWDPAKAMQRWFAEQAAEKEREAALGKRRINGT
jgi:hypothetical protein